MFEQITKHVADLTGHSLTTIPSASHSKFFNQLASVILTGVLIHLFCVGLSIALIVRRGQS